MLLPWNNRYSLNDNAWIQTTKDFLTNQQIEELCKQNLEVKWKSYCSTSFGCIKPFNHLSTMWTNDCNVQSYVAHYRKKYVGKYGSLYGKIKNIDLLSSLRYKRSIQIFGLIKLYKFAARSK